MRMRGKLPLAIVMIEVIATACNMWFLAVSQLYKENLWILECFNNFRLSDESGAKVQEGPACAS